MSDITYEDVNSEEYLTEMAQIRPKGGFSNFGFLVTVNRESRKDVCSYNPEHQINPYNNVQPDYKIINEPK